MATAEMKKEALSRLEDMTRKLHLNPHIVDYFKQDRIYYSYTTFMGGCINTVTYDPRFPRIIADFERMYNCYVYHAILCGDMLSLLFVSSYESDWPEERLHSDGTICTYTHNFSEPDFSEIGYIGITSDNGAIIRDR